MRFWSFFFQAEDGIRDRNVTGVQTCALPISDFQWVSLEQISPYAASAVIASEDQQFPFHAGFDFDSIREAVRSEERRVGKECRCGWRPCARTKDGGVWRRGYCGRRCGT